MISEFVDRQAANADLYELEDVLTGEKRQYRIVSKATVTVPGTDLNKATFDPILSGLQSIGEFEKMAVLIDDWNAVTENGIYMANGGANAPVSGEWHMGLVMHHNNAYSVQRVCAFASTKKWYERHKMNGSWDAWAEYEGSPGPPGPSGPNEVRTNTATNITGLLKGNGANVLAAEAGVDFATAGIADSGGSASTGYWVKYDDGTMIWTATRTMSVEPFSASGSLYISSFIDLGTFPESFYGTPFVKAEQQYEPTKWTTSVTNTSSTSVGKVAVLSALATTNGTPLSIKCFAIGRWK